MIAELTGMEIANASLLDEATAAAEAMPMAHAVAKAKSDVLAVADDVHPQTLAVLATRARPLGFTLVDVAAGDAAAIARRSRSACCCNIRAATGAVRDLRRRDRGGARARRAGHRRRRPARAGRC